MARAVRTTERLGLGPDKQRNLADHSSLWKRPMWGRWILLAAVAGGLSGCSDQEPVRHYKVPKPDQLYASNHVEKTAAAAEGQGSIKPAASHSTKPTDRLLGAIVPFGEKTWYFKMTGPIGAVATQKDAFRQLVESISFADQDAKPTWTLPKGWTAKPGSGQRLATLTVDVDGQTLEVSVIPLANSPSTNWLLDNVNRWRRQIGLGPTTSERLKTETEQIRIDGATAVWVELTGQFRGGMGSTSTASPAAAMLGSSRNKRPAATPRFTLPDGWFQAKGDSFSRIALGVRDGDESVRITVSVLPGTAGGLLPNFNRWRAQVGLPPISQEQLVQQAESLKIDGVAGPYLEAAGPNAQAPKNAIYGWIGVESGRSWFVKLKGDAKLAQQQQGAFRAFLNSLQFSASDGDGNGK